MSYEFRWCVPAATALVVAGLFGCASEKPASAFETAFNDETKTWKEIESQLPAPPANVDLVEFPVSGATSYRFAVDTKSLSVGSDGVFRFTLVATSPSGVRNVSYEGIRCETNEKKIYATGRGDGTWTRARNASWAEIPQVGNNRQEAALKTDILCPDGFDARSPEVIVRRLHPTTGPSEANFDRGMSGYNR